MPHTIQWDLAYSHFQTFRNCLPDLIDETCVSEYHAIIDSIEEAGQLNLQDFRIEPNKMLFHMVKARAAEQTASRMRVQYSNSRYCDSDHFSWKLIQLQGFLNSTEQTV